MQEIPNIWEKICALEPILVNDWKVDTKQRYAFFTDSLDSTIEIK